MVLWSSGFAFAKLGVEYADPLTFLMLRYAAVLVILARAEIETTAILGVLLSVAALLGLTAATLYEQRFGIEAHPVSANIIQFIVGFGLLLPLAALLETMWVEWTADFALALAYLVIANSLISVTLLLAMLRRGDTGFLALLPDATDGCLGGASDPRRGPAAAGLDRYAAGGRRRRRGNTCPLTLTRPAP